MIIRALPISRRARFSSRALLAIATTYSTCCRSRNANILGLAKPPSKRTAEAGRGGVVAEKQGKGRDEAEERAEKPAEAKGKRGLETTEEKGDRRP